jgi:hypothetical protein
MKYISLEKQKVVVLYLSWQKDIATALQRWYVVRKIAMVVTTHIPCCRDIYFGALLYYSVSSIFMLSYQKLLIQHICGMFKNVK